MTETTTDGLVHHYTTLEGLMGILNCGVLWASHPAFMNDTAERTRGLQLAKQRLDVYHAKEFDTFAHNHSKWGDWLRNDSTFVACFTTDPDALSMWRGYGAGSGVSISFGRTGLEELMDKRLGDVLYEEEEYLREVDERLKKELTKRSGGERLCEDLFGMAALLKSEHWKDEKELRLSVNHRRGRDADLKFRPGPWGLIPYCLVPSPPTAGKCEEVEKIGEGGGAESVKPLTGLVRKITIGPAMYPEEVREGLSWFLPTVGLSNVRVETSSVTLRPRP